jgi:hypothetical protein
MIITEAAVIALQYLNRPARADEIHRTILSLKLMTMSEVSTSEGVRVKIEMLCENSRRADKPNMAMRFRRVAPGTYDLLKAFKVKSYPSSIILEVLSRKRRLNN